MKINTDILSNNSSYNFIGWKSYNCIKKKAKEQNFSWAGLFISLFIAFFIVLFSALGLRFFHDSVESAKRHKNFLNQKVYYLEDNEYINKMNRIDFKKNIKIEIV